MMPSALRWKQPGSWVPGRRPAQDRDGGPGSNCERGGARKPVQRAQEGALGSGQCPDHLAVTIGDEGEGFDLASLPDPLAEHNLLQQSGRGIFLIRAFMDEFEVRRRVPGGTEVRLVKYLDKKQ